MSKSIVSFEQSLTAFKKIGITHPFICSAVINFDPNEMVTMTVKIALTEDDLRILGDFSDPKPEGPMNIRTTYK